MKRFLTAIAIVLSSSILLSLAGCGGLGTTASAYESYTQANESMNNLESYSANMSAKMNMSVNDESFDYDFTGNIKQVIKSDTEFEMEFNGSMQGDSISFYFKDGYMYYNMMGQKIRLEMPVDNLQSQANTSTLSFPEEAVVEQSVKKSGKNTEINMTLESEDLNLLLRDQLSSSLTQMFNSYNMTVDDMSFTVDDLKLNVVIDKNNNIKSYNMLCTINMIHNENPMTITMDMTLEFNEINNVSIDYPDDLDTYNDLSELF